MEADENFGALVSKILNFDTVPHFAESLLEDHQKRRVSHKE